MTRKTKAIASLGSLAAIVGVGAIGFLAGTATTAAKATAEETCLFAMQQRGPGGPGGQGGPGMRGGMRQMGGAGILRMPEVQQHLGLNQSQIGQIQTILEENRPPRGEPGTPPDPQAMREMERRVDGLIKGVLSAQQYARYKQLELQAGGPQAFSRPDVAERLQLTDAQKGQIRTILEQMRPPRPEPGQDPPAPPSPDEMRQRREAAMTAIMNLLTTNQKQTWQGMVGEKFEFPAMGGGRGGRGGGGGGGFAFRHHSDVQ